MIKKAAFVFLTISAVMASTHIVPFEAVWLVAWLAMTAWFTYLYNVSSKETI